MLFITLSLEIVISVLFFSGLASDSEKGKSNNAELSSNPIAGSYKSRGEVLSLSSDLRAYQVGKGNKNGVILVYDIFGFDIPQTRRFADTLADDSFNVIMPDFFRGTPWSLDDFPPKDYSQLVKWMNEAGSFDVVKKDLVLALKRLQETGAHGKPGIIGFCWGGKMVMYATQSSDFSCGVSIHGSGVTAELAKYVTVPIMFLPSGQDPSLDDVQKVLDGKPFGRDCVYYRFDKMMHGFASARGDWNNEETRKDILSAISMSSDFLKKHSS